MSEWIVYSKDGKTERCSVKKLEYSGEFLGACSVSVSIVSPTPIEFELGDYLEYRGERFEMNYDPSVVKQSSYGYYGEGFVYDDVVFNSLSDELTRCDFLDYVKSGSDLHYSSLPTFSFFAESIDALADRIQANLDRIYTDDKKWTVEVHDEYVNTLNVNVQVSNNTVWDALGFVNSKFGASFIIRNRTITIGTTGLAVGQVFSYGKGNGLFKIERNAESNQKIITRLRAYGSTRNMPSDYYRRLGLEVFSKVSEVVSKGTDTAPYIELILDLPYSEGYFLKDADYSGKLVMVKTGDVEIRGKIIKDTTTGKCKFYSEIKSSSEDNSDEPNEEKFLAFREAVAEGSKVYFTTYVNKEAFPLENKEYANNVPNNMAVKNLMLPSFPYETNDPYIESENAEELGIREGTVFFDGSSELEEIYPTMEGMTAEDLAKAGVTVSATGALDVVSSAEQVSDDGKFEEGAKIPNFTITLKDIGFDINGYLSTSGSATISMKDGMCGGREFEIVSCEKSGSYYVLECKRTHDESLDLYYPYKDYQIKGGDKFVLLNIEMPEVYVKAASQRLLEAATAYLAKNDYVRYSYTLNVDNLFMARQHDKAVAEGLKSIHDTIKEGDLMLFEDDDLGVNGSITISSLRIKENSDESIIPEYEITLQDEKTVGTIEKIQNQISSILNGGVGGSELNVEQVQSIIKAYGDKLFLRKDKDDQTKYLLKLLGGAHVGEAVDSMLAGKGTVMTTDGRIQTERLEVRGSMTVMDLIINQLQGLVSDYIFSDVGKVVSVTDMGEDTYLLHLEKKTESDILSLSEGDVLHQIVNSIPKGGTDYYSSWMRVIATNANEYSVTVVLYPDEEAPGGVNYAPVKGYNLAHKGNSVLPDEGGVNERAQYWMLSSREGRIQFLQNVFKPILEDYNYALTVGKLPDIEAVRNLPVTPNQDVGVVAQTVIAERFYQFDYNGDIKPNKVDRGEWSLEVAQGESPYRYVQHDRLYPDGEHKYVELEQHTVYHYGCKWGCLVDKTTDEPRWNSPSWSLLEGDKNYYIVFESTNGFQFTASNMSTVITATVVYANRDITDVLMATSGVEVEWLRDTGNVALDNSWSPTTVGDKTNVISLERSDMGDGWMDDYRKVKFTCRIHIPYGEEFQTIENSINYKI